MATTATAASDPRRQKLLLGFLIVVLLVFGWRYRDFFVARLAGSAEASEEINVGERAAQVMEIPIPGERLLVARNSSLGRNVFDFALDPRIAAERRRQEREREQLRVEKEQLRKKQEEQRKVAQQNNPPKPRKPPEPQPPEFRYSYVAYYGYGGDDGLAHEAVLIPANKRRDGAKKADIRLVRLGDIVDDKFVVKSIDFDAVTIGFTDKKFEGKEKRIDLIAGKGAPDSRSKGSSRRGRRRR